MVFFVKIVIAVVVILAASELSKRNVTWAAILLAMPIVLLTSFTIVWEETHDSQLISRLIQETLLFIIPVIPFLFLFSWMLKSNLSYYLSLLISCIAIIIVTLIIQKFFN
tara:strand:+ start:1567 stop:1896 length:330 start_codon:yes stop_codon:yes gene_type:complete